MPYNDISIGESAVCRNRIISFILRFLRLHLYSAQPLRQRLQHSLSTSKQRSTPTLQNRRSCMSHSCMALRSRLPEYIMDNYLDSLHQNHHNHGRNTTRYRDSCHTITTFHVCAAPLTPHCYTVSYTYGSVSLRLGPGSRMQSLPCRYNSHPLY
jgi:hypothetical protein